MVKVFDQETRCRVGLVPPESAALVGHGREPFAVVHRQERLGRTVAAVRKKLRDEGYTADSLGGYKVKEVADMFSVPPARVQYWVAEKLLLTKGGRITDSSMSKFLVDHPEKIPFESLSMDMQKWLREMGYKDRRTDPKATGGVPDERYSFGRTQYASAAESQLENEG